MLVSFAELASPGAVSDAEAVFASACPTVPLSLATSATVLVAPAASVPRLHRTVVTLLAVACVHVAAGLTDTDLNCALSGSLSVATTPLAAAGPLLVTVTVYVASAAFFALAGPVAFTARSAVGVTVT